MAQFKKIGNTFFTTEDSGQLNQVVDKDTLKGLKDGQLQFVSESNQRGLSFADEQPLASSGGIDTQSQGIQQDDIQSLIKSRLAKTLKNFAGVTNTDQLEARRQELLRKQLISAPFSQEGERLLTGAQKLSLLRQRGSEFEPEIKALEEEIIEARQNPLQELQILNSLFDLQEKMSPTKAKDDKTFTQSSSLRKEFLTASNEFVKQRDSFVRIQKSASDPSPAGDLALIFNFMKLLDPGSVVRETEFATASNAAGVPERTRNFYNRLLSGERLGPDDGFQRQDFVDRAVKLFVGAKEVHTKRVGEYRRLANSLGLDPQNIIVDLELAGRIGASVDEESGEEEVDLEDSGEIFTSSSGSTYNLPN